MMKSIAALLACMNLVVNAKAYADYPRGCDDPQYHQFVNDRFAHIEAKNRRLLSETLRDYQRSLASGNNPYQVIGALSRHLKYSAQFDPISMVNAKIDRIFEHADELSVSQQIAGDVFDSFSSETHAVGIARAWLAYRQGKHDEAFDALLTSIDVNDSAVLRSFGPDFDLIRHIYRDGHKKPVIAYINKTNEFWTGKRADRLRYVWLKMIHAECMVQFDSVDAIKVLELDLGVLDENKDYGLRREPD